MLKLKVRIFKPSGKWYADEDVEVRSDKFQEICDDIKSFLHPYGGGFMGAFETPERMIGGEVCYSFPHLVIDNG